MAAPRVSENAATQSQFVAQLAITAALTQALGAAWESVSARPLDEALASFRAAARALTVQWAQAGQVITLDNYRAARSQAGVTTVLQQPRLVAVPESKIGAGIAWAERGAQDLIDAKAEADQISARILNRVQAASDKVAADSMREITMLAVEGDEMALGYRRVPRPDACAWCLILATRTTQRAGFARDVARPGSRNLRGVGGGLEHWGVYKSRASAGQVPPNDKDEINRFHDHCHCAVEPIFSVVQQPEPWVLAARDLYDQTGSLNAFRRALNAQRRGEDAPPPTAPNPFVVSPAMAEAQAAAISDLLAGLNAAMGRAA